MRKIEIEFEEDFATTSVIAKQIGRIMLGPCVGRLCFHPDGNVRLHVSERAREFIIYHPNIDSLPLGFPSK